MNVEANSAAHGIGMQPTGDQAAVRKHRGVSASKYLHDKYGIQMAPQTLAKHRVYGTGPEFVMDGRFPLYPETGLDRFAQERLGTPRTSTSGARRAAA